MFSSKYIFETKNTRMMRYLRNFIILMFIFVLTYLAAGYLFILSSDLETKKSKEAFYKKAPDLIVVFTGDKGRIPYALKLAKEYKSSQVFITGVHNKNNLETLLEPLPIKDEVNSENIEIDYLARNTIENAVATLRHLREKRGLKDILVISHDYHILRIKTILGAIRSDEDDYQFYFSAITTDYSISNNFKKLYKEVYKFLRSFLFLMIWDSDLDSVQIEL
ncbi:MAG: YdcF family protein [Oligoflexia bacterium]|nr:YdcF family protein [Oligoflexia bacterium]